MSRSRLPDFIIIGATKSATTWLTENLRAHRQVFMPSSELHYFSRTYEQGEASYRAQFADAPDGRLIGEKSASYLPHPDAPDRLRRLLPEARLIAQLRNPIERAYSDYCMHYRRGQVSRDIARYLDPARTPIPRLLDDGYYHRHLGNFLRVFPAEQLEIVLYDDVRSRPGEVFESVCAFLGIAHVAPAAVGERVKDKETPVVPPAARRLLAPLKGMVQPFRETSTFRFARGLIAKRLDYPPLTPELRSRLAACYADDVARLGALLERDLSAWLAAPRADQVATDRADRYQAPPTSARRPARA